METDQCSTDGCRYDTTSSLNLSTQEKRCKKCFGIHMYMGTHEKAGAASRKVFMLSAERERPGMGGESLEEEGGAVEIDVRDVEHIEEHIGRKTGEISDMFDQQGMFGIHQTYAWMDSLYSLHSRKILKRPDY